MSSLRRAMPSVSLILVTITLCLFIVNFRNKFVANPRYYVEQNAPFDMMLYLHENSTVIPSKQTIKLKQYDPYEYLTKVFQPWDYDKYDFPCFPAEKSWLGKDLRSPTQNGIIFIKNMKTGSSTVSGITIRIARSMAKKQKGMSWETEFPLCKVRFDHSAAMKLQSHLRDKEKSFLFSFVRDPTKRIISEFFHFAVSREKIDPSDKNFQRFIMRQSHTNNYYLKDMGLSHFGHSNFTVHVQQILSGYDFIGVTERLNESLIVLKMLLRLKMRDILYLSAKKNGGFDDGASKFGCVYIVPSFVSPGMKDWFSTPVFQRRIAGDQMLYNAAVRSLDATIDSIGREEVERQVAVFRSAQKKAEDICLTNTTFPCSPGGQKLPRDNCYFWDCGCGYQCLDGLNITELDE